MAINDLRLGGGFSLGQVPLPLGQCLHGGVQVLARFPEEDSPDSHFLSQEALRDVLGKREALPR